NSPTLSCLLRCDKYPCPRDQDCKFGLVEDPCKCCQDGVCAKGVNEDCEGKWNHAGTCADGLICDRVFPRFPQLPGICKPDLAQKFDTN
uniref:Uncharacterized protein n=1 Tax=Strigamia maritima TaxID=126957 RepID=T1J3M2_STRMM